MKALPTPRIWGSQGSPGKLEKIGAQRAPDLTNCLMRKGDNMNEQDVFKRCVYRIYER